MAALSKPQIKFCTTREAAELLGISMKTAQLWSESGLLEAWRTEGGHRRIYRESVERLLTAGGVSKPAEPEGDRPAQLSILVAEDDEALRKLYDIRLRTWPMAPRVQVVSTGIEALIEIGRRPPDLLITDLRMPEMDGFSMLRVLRNITKLEDMQIVVVSGLDPSDIQAKGGVPEGVQIYPKPIPFDALEQFAVALAASKKAIA